jgi:Putative MetA-pathway of phenol degradation
MADGGIGHKADALETVLADGQAFRAACADDETILGSHGESNVRRASRMQRAGHRAGLLLILAFPMAVHAAHPLISEDTATQGRGKVELEIGNAWTRDGSDRSFELGPQLSYGVLAQLDAILRPTWLDQRSTIDGDTAHARGAGDTAADIKWRFFQRGKLSLAVRAGVNAPTGDADRGLGSGKLTYHGLLAASIDLAPFALHSNIGYTRNRADPMERRDLYHASAAAVLTIDATWRLLLAELAADTNGDHMRSVWPAVARVGAIYTVKRGFDVDIGYQRRLNRAASSQVLLAGVTARWGP